MKVEVWHYWLGQLGMVIFPLAYVYFVVMIYFPLRDDFYKFWKERFEVGKGDADGILIVMSLIAIGMLLIGLFHINDAIFPISSYCASKWRGC